MRNAPTAQPPQPTSAPAAAAGEEEGGVNAAWCVVLCAARPSDGIATNSALRMRKSLQESLCRVISDACACDGRRSFEIEEGGPPANKKAKAKRAMEQKSGRKIPEVRPRGPRDSCHRRAVAEPGRLHSRCVFSGTRSGIRREGFT